MDEYSDFRDSIKKVNLPRVHKITNSITTYEIYKLIRKLGWKGIGKPVTEKDFYTIIRQVNALLVLELMKGKEIHLPARLGAIELRKKPTRAEIVNGELVTNLPVDWDATLKLWYEDEQSYKDRVLIRCEDKEVFRVFYNKSKANYTNKTFYSFRPTRSIKNQLSKLAKLGNIDAYLLNRYD